MTGIFWNPGVFSYAMMPRCHPKPTFHLFIVTSIVYGFFFLLVFYELKSPYGRIANYQLNQLIAVLAVLNLLVYSCQYFESSSRKPAS
jgi:hypothetical protein